MKSVSVRQDIESYLYETHVTSPERKLLIYVFDRALRDLREPNLSLQEATYAWFMRKQVLLPAGIGYGDILEHGILDAHRIQYVEHTLATHWCSSSFSEAVLP
jgi:hypothetical protein